jgi:hypothetical protein
MKTCACDRPVVSDCCSYFLAAGTVEIAKLLNLRIAANRSSGLESRLLRCSMQKPKTAIGDPAAQSLSLWPLKAMRLAQSW